MKDQLGPRMSPDRGSFVLLRAILRSVSFATNLTKRKFHLPDFGDNLPTNGKFAAPLE